MNSLALHLRCSLWSKPALLYARNSFPKPAARHASNQFVQERTQPAEGETPAPEKLDIEKLLSQPTWSVQSLLPPQEQADEPSPISSKELHHLLRLSALPPPKTAQEEADMLKTLASQLHFVKEIQKVDTTGVTPLRAIRDERLEVEKEQEITLESLDEALQQEEVVGKHYKRIRRKLNRPSPPRNPEGWNPLELAQRKSGKFFVVAKRRMAKEGNAIDSGEFKEIIFHHYV